MNRAAATPIIGAILVTAAWLGAEGVARAESASEPADAEGAPAAPDTESASNSADAEGPPEGADAENPFDPREGEGAPESAESAPPTEPAQPEPPQPAARNAPTPDVPFAAGVVAYLEGDYDEAARSFREVLDAQQDHLRAAHYLGLCMIALESYEDAVDVLEIATQDHPNSQELRMALGIAYLLWGNDTFAARTLRAVAEADPDSASARYYLGAALSRQGDCDLASRYLAEARRLDDSYGPRSQYLAGLCRVREGDFEQAHEELRPLAQSPLDEPIADAARGFVRMALRMEGIETERFSVRGAASVQFDSNPSLSPNPDDAYPSVATVFQAAATVRPVASEGHTLAAQTAFYRSFYFPDEHASDYNYTHVSASVFYQLRGEVGPVRHQLQMGYDFAVGFYDGDQLTDSNHIYSELHGARVVWSIREAADLQSRVSVLVQHRSYNLLRRNNVGATIGFGQTIALPSVGMQLYLEGTVRVEDASNLDYDVVAPGALASLSWRAPWELLIAAWIHYEHESHPASNDDRRDEKINSSLSIQRQIIDHLGLTLSWMHTENISNVEDFHYRQDVVSLTLWGTL